MLKETFQKNMRAIREQLGMTQRDLADRTGLHVKAISRFEAGEPQNVTLDMCERVAKGLGIEPIELLSETRQFVSSKKSLKEFDEALKVLRKFRNKIG